jgi:cysteine desulfurase
MKRCLDFDGIFGNPHSQTHDYGLAAANLVTGSEESFAKIINASPSEIIFTSGATESNNLALQGAAYFYQSRGNHIITSQTEHKAVLDVMKFLEKQGFRITYLSVNKQGLISLEELTQAITPETILVSIMMVNNETGVIQPIKTIANIVHTHKIIFHVDAAQALGKLPIDVRDLDVDLMSFSGHKIYGPKGSGALFVRSRPKVHLRPLIYGGGQQQGLRAGTESPSLITGLTCAAVLATKNLSKENKRISELRTQLWQGLKDLPKVKFNTDFEHSVPHICSITLKGLDGETCLLHLQKKLALAQGSACTSAHIEPSHVLRAMGLTQLDADSTFRVSLGRYTTKKDIKTIIKVIKELTGS